MGKIKHLGEKFHRISVKILVLSLGGGKSPLKSDLDVLAENLYIRKMHESPTYSYPTFIRHFLRLSDINGKIL